VFCDTFDTSISIMSTNVSIPVSKRSRSIAMPRNRQVLWWYYWYAVCNWIALLLTTTAHRVTATKKTRHIKTCQTCSKHIFLSDSRVFQTLRGI